MKIKVSELTGTALDWAVAKCEGYVEEGVYGEPKIIDDCLHLHYCDVVLSSDFKPTMDWSQGGPIIEREDISLTHSYFNEEVTPEVFHLRITHHIAGIHFSVVLGHKHQHIERGPTALIAAMRCFCASKLGDEVEIPKELT